MPTRFFPAKLLAPVQRILQALDLFAQRRGAPRHGNEAKKENAPADHVSPKHAPKMFFHAASASRSINCTSPRIASRRYRSRTRKTMRMTRLKNQNQKTVAIVGSSPDPEPH